MSEKANIFNMIHANMDQSENFKTIKLEGTCFAGGSIQVRNTLDMASAIGFSQAISDDCSNYDNAEYTPEVFDFSVRLHTIEFFTMLDISEDLDVMYDVLYQTNLFSTVFDNVNQEQFRTLVAQAQDRISFNREMMISTAAQKTEELIDKLREFTSGSDKIIDFVGSPEFAEYMGKLIPQEPKKKRSPRKKKSSPASASGESQGDMGKVIPLKGTDQDG